MAIRAPDGANKEEDKWEKKEMNGQAHQMGAS